MYSPTDDMNPKTILMREANKAEAHLAHLSRDIDEEVVRHADIMAKYEEQRENIERLFQQLKEAIEKME